ncbi:MAG TPA: tRNA1(Val) (adenine(37)-N6)-methyltransferase [Bacillales bacterium]|nr:tRNA1(Val) (adenine(37)-N6)-methyltransferase [Bacillales bacterium]
MDFKKGERLDYLFFDKQLKIIQRDGLFSFSLDSLLLAAFVHVPIQKGNLIDLCSGNGAIPLMLSRRTKGRLTGVEIQREVHEMAEKSVRLNQLEDRIRLVCADLKDMPEELKADSFDVVTCNPPYFSPSTESSVTENPSVAAARHELHTTLEDVVSVSGKLLKQGGKAAFVFPPARMVEFMALMRVHRLEPKRLLWVQPKPGKEANRMLIEGKKDAKPGLRVLPPLVVYNEDNEYTKELRAFCDITSTP